MRHKLMNKERGHTDFGMPALFVVYRKPRHSGGVQKRLTDVERQKNSDCVRIEATCQSQTRNNTIGGHYNE